MHNFEMIRNGNVIFFIITFALSLFGCSIKIFVDHGVPLSKKKGPELENLTEQLDDVRQCKLNGLVNRFQENSSWCWIASTQMVLEYITEEPIPSQCDFATEVFTSDLQQAKQGSAISQNTSLECCQAIDKRSLNSINTSAPTDFTKQISQQICINGGWPEEVFNNLAQSTGKSYDWVTKDNWARSDPNLVWKAINDEICQNRPFIFVVRWDGGGRHSSVIGGTQIIGVTKYVEVYDHFPIEGETDFFLMPFDIFLGDPGEFEHEYDFIKIKTLP